MKHVAISFVACCVLLAAPVTNAAERDIVAGHYAIESQMVLPHMEAMRRTSKHADVCIEKDDAAKLFPSFQHLGLRGCTLKRQQGDTEGIDFTLHCPGVNGAHGSARLTFPVDHIKGELSAKLGGKNMTFFQYIDARREGVCQQPISK